MRSVINELGVSAFERYWSGVLLHTNVGALPCKEHVSTRATRLCGQDRRDRGRGAIRACFGQVNSAHATSSACSIPLKGGGESWHGVAPDSNSTPTKHALALAFRHRWRLAFFEIWYPAT